MKFSATLLIAYLSLSGFNVQAFQTTNSIHSRSKDRMRIRVLPDTLDLPSVSSKSVNVNIPASITSDSMLEMIVRKISSIGEGFSFPDMSPLGSDLLSPVVDVQQLIQTASPVTSPLVSANAIGTYVEIGLALIAGITLYKLSYPEEDFRRGYEPYPRGSYDPLVAKAYYARHPVLVLKRTLQLLRFSNSFIFNVLFDKYIRRDEEKYRPERAKELLELIQKAGPTAIKVGQALSVRPDLIPPEYAEALVTLQDRVPPFPTDEAKALLQQELSTSITKLDMNNSMNKPVASASIGQVYKGTATLSDGSTKEVAVKIQRPDVLAEIALDLHIVREFAPTYQKITRSATDYQSLANEWGRGFIAELSYTEEAKNTIQFNREMQTRGLTAVTAPNVVPELSTERVLVTEWVTGTRLDRSTADDVPRLCSVALNAYLLMLLETGTLHCDPHAGNILRTDDGKLCILDWGMTLQTEPGLQYSLLEFVAHLTSEDYDRVPDDLVKLGFLKAERLETVRASGFLEPLTYILKQAGQGGGGTKVRERIFAEYRERYPGLDDDELRYAMRDDMQKQIEEARKKESAVTGITMEVEELQKKNQDAFSIPEWFLYTSRAFLTLEGICLQADEDYSIIKSCFPYIARRLLNDDSPRAQLALKELIYGASGSLDINRLTDLAGGFSTYTTTQKSINQNSSKNDVIVKANMSASATQALKARKSRIADTEAAITLAKDGAEILLNPEGNFVQNLIVDESAAALSAQVKDALKDALIDRPNRLRGNLPFNIGSLLPPPPKEIEPFFRKTIEEENAQALLTKISSNAAPQGLMSSTSSNDEQLQAVLDNIDIEQIAVISREVRENLPKYGPLIGQLGGKFVASVLERTSIDIDRNLIEIESDNIESTNNPVSTIVKSAARTVSDTANRSAKAIKSS